MSWEEIREKSYDYAWKNIAKNRPISVENLVIETATDESYIEYLKEQSLLAKSLKSRNDFLEHDSYRNV